MDRNIIYKVLCIIISCGTHFILQNRKTLKLHFDFTKKYYLKTINLLGRVGGLDSQFVIK